MRYISLLLIIPFSLFVIYAAGYLYYKRKFENLIKKLPKILIDLKVLNPKKVNCKQ